MSLITKDYVKERFPQWEHYAAFDDEATDTDEALQKQIDEAEIELADYVTVDQDSLTDTLKRHLVRITKKNLFDLQHSDTEFDRDPGIYKDYKQTIELLTQLRDGERPSKPQEPDSAQGSIKIKSKKRRFNSWFRDMGSQEVNSTDENTP